MNNAKYSFTSTLTQHQRIDALYLRVSFLPSWVINPSSLLWNGLFQYLSDLKFRVGKSLGPGWPEAATDQAAGVLSLVGALRLGHPTQTCGAGPAPERGLGWASEPSLGTLEHTA